MPKNTLNGKVQRKENRRVRYTRMALRETLLSLLQQYPLNKITVSRICEQADVNRSTFYLYYKDAYDLLDQIETELYEQISQALEGTSYMLPNVEMLQRIYEIIYKNRDLCRILFGEFGDKVFLRKVGNIHKDQMMREWRKLGKNLDETTLSYLHTFAAYTNIGVMERWIASDFHETPAQLASLVNKMLTNGISAFLPTR